MVGRGEVGEGGEVWVSCGVERVRETGECDRGQEGVAGDRRVWQEAGGCGRGQEGVVGDRWAWNDTERGPDRVVRDGMTGESKRAVSQPMGSSCATVRGPVGACPHLRGFGVCCSSPFVFGIVAAGVSRGQRAEQL